MTSQGHNLLNYARISKYGRLPAAGRLSETLVKRATTNITEINKNSDGTFRFRRRMPISKRAHCVLAETQA